MATISELLARAAALRDETAINSIDPNRAGGIMYDTLMCLNTLWVASGSSLVISKIYASVAAMQADTAPVSDLTGKALRPGQIVVIASSDADNGTVYRYDGPSAWSAVGKIGNLPVIDSLDSDSATTPLAAHQGKVLDGKISQLGQKTDGLIARYPNLLNPNDADVLIGYYIDNGVVLASSSYNSSGYIPVEPNTTYYKSLGGTSFRYVNYYNSSKQFISYEQNKGVFTTPSNCAYVRISMLATGWATAQVSELYIAYIEFGVYLSLVKQTGPYNDSIATKKYVDDSLLQSGLPEVVESMVEMKGKTDLLLKKPSPNLLNPNDTDVLLGYYIQGAATYQSATYNSSGFIPVSEGTNYYKSKGGTSFRFVNYYNSSKQIISYEENKGTFTTPANCAYVRISMMTTGWDTAQVSAQNIPYVAFGDSLSLVNTNVLNDDSIPTKKYVDENSFDILRGKKWCPLGDSFTDGATTSVIPDGKYAGKRKVYPYFIGNRTGINVINTFFLSGRTLAMPANPGTFTNSICNPNANFYYQNIPADVDYITIYLGINDSHHAPGSSGGDGEDNTGEIPLGTINDNTPATYYGAWNVVLTWLRTNRPFAHIGIIVTNGAPLTYRTAQKEIAKKFGIPTLDLNGDDRCPAMIRPANNDIPADVKDLILRAQAVDYDGSQTGTPNHHPNDDAHLFESYFIESFLRTI